MDASSGMAAAILMKSDGQDIWCLSVPTDIPSSFHGSCLRPSRPPRCSSPMHGLARANTDVHLMSSRWGLSYLRRRQKWLPDLPLSERTALICATAANL